MQTECLCLCIDNMIERNQWATAGAVQVCESSENIPISATISWSCALLPCGRCGRFTIPLPISPETLLLMVFRPCSRLGCILNHWITLRAYCRWHTMAPSHRCPFTGPIPVPVVSATNAVPDLSPPKKSESKRVKTR